MPQGYLSSGDSYTKHTDETVKFAGFKITMEGIKPTNKYVEAIRNFPTPTNISEVRGEPQACQDQGEDALVEVQDLA